MMLRFNLYARFWLLPLPFTFATKTTQAIQIWRNLTPATRIGPELSAEGSKEDRDDPKRYGWQHVFRMRGGHHLRLYI